MFDLSKINDIVSKIESIISQLNAFVEKVAPLIEKIAPMFGPDGMAVASGAALADHFAQAGDAAMKAHENGDSVTALGILANAVGDKNTQLGITPKVAQKIKDIVKTVASDPPPGPRG